MAFENRVSTSFNMFELMISSHGVLTTREKINIHLNCWINEYVCVCVCFFNFIQLLTNKMNVEQHVIFEINSSLSHSRCALIICKPSPLFEDFHVLQAFAISLHSAHYGFRRFRKIISICLEYITNVYQVNTINSIQCNICWYFQFSSSFF